MQKDNFNQWILILERQTVALEKIAELLDRHLPRQPAPNITAILENFSHFDWPSIGAKVEVTDKYGVALVSWNHNLYQRRSPDNAYGAVIYFSRCVGKSDSGSNEYERLITFKPSREINPKAISREAESLIR